MKKIFVFGVIMAAYEYGKKGEDSFIGQMIGDIKTVLHLK